MTATGLQQISLSGVAIEYKSIAASDPLVPQLVFLHEGLGCTVLWRDFPDQLCAATGCGGLVYSRQGYGGSDPCSLPRPLDYMQIEAREVLPELLSRLEIENFILVGHSDGASIALVYAGLQDAPSPKGVIALAPHVFCEDISVEGIEAAKRAYEQGDLKEKLTKFHRINIDCAFYGWNGAWLDPDFMNWNIEAYLPAITIPVLAIQGLDDEYGTVAQIDAIERGVGGPFTKLLLEDCGHNPWQEKRNEVLAGAIEFILQLPR